MKFCKIGIRILTTDINFVENIFNKVKYLSLKMQNGLNILSYKND